MSDLKKSLPKRCMSEKLKERRRRSWERGQERKVLRRTQQEARHRANLARRAQGLPTPWEEAKAARARVYVPPGYVDTLGAYQYATAAGTPGSETVAERTSRERFWSMLRRQIEAGARL